MLRDSRLWPWAESQGHHTIDGLVSGERHRGKKRLQSTTLKGRDRVTANEANIGTDVKATLKNLLQLSGKKAPALRKKHREEERDAIIHRQQILQETQEKKMQAETRKREKILDIHSKLRPHQGPCSEPADIDKLLTSYTSAVQRLRAVKAELQFQKLVLMHPSP